MTAFLTTQEVQDLLHVDRSTIYRMAEDGRLPAVKVGRQWRFAADRVAEQLGLPTPEPAEQPTPRAVASTRPVRDLLQPHVAQSMADLLGELFGIMAVITDMEGQPLTAVANPCGYYAAIADQPGAASACLAEWRHFAAEPHVSPRFVPTHLGFLCARSFIWVDLRPVGMLVLGGVTPTAWPPPLEHTETVAAEIGVSPDVLTSAVTRTFDLDLDEQRRVLRLLPQVGDLISQLASARGQLLDKLDAIAVLAGSGAPHGGD